MPLLRYDNDYSDGRVRLTQVITVLLSGGGYNHYIHWLNVILYVICVINTRSKLHYLVVMFNLSIVFFYSNKQHAVCWHFNSKIECVTSKLTTGSLQTHQRHTSIPMTRRKYVTSSTPPPPRDTSKHSKLLKHTMGKLSEIFLTRCRFKYSRSKLALHMASLSYLEVLYMFV